MKQYKWTRYSGYEVSSKGDRRFSAFNAIMPDGRSIEVHYQCDVKGYATWQEGKGKLPLNESVDLWGEYLLLWREWARNHPELIEELRQLVAPHDNVLSDRFAKTSVNQARALAVILEETQSV